MVSEKAKMLSGQIYNASDPTLVKERSLAHEVCRMFNSQTTHGPDELRQLFTIFGSLPEGAYIEPPFHCDYGYNIHLGKGVYFNFNVTILDCANVSIGDHVKFGPGVQLYTAGHSLDAQRRRAGDEFALPIVIEEDVWVGGSAVILPGVRIGKRSVVGAGAVVTKDVPPDAVVVGNPARALTP